MYPCASSVTSSLSFPLPVSNSFFNSSPTHPLPRSLPLTPSPHLTTSPPSPLPFPSTRLKLLLPPLPPSLFPLPGNYEKIADVVGPEYIASSILPTIQPLLVDRSLNKQQFALVVNLTRSLLQRVVCAVAPFLSSFPLPPFLPLPLPPFFPSFPLIGLSEPLIINQTKSFCTGGDANR